MPCCPVIRGSHLSSQGPSFFFLTHDQCCQRSPKRTNLLEFKLIEPSISHYSNPVFFVPKPPLRDGSPGGLRFVWDGRSVNRAIKTDSFLIPRVEDLIERITRLKHEANVEGIT